MRKIAASRAAVSSCAWRAGSTPNSRATNAPSGRATSISSADSSGGVSVRAVAVRREARRQRRVARGQRGAELRVQRRQPLGLVQIAVPEAVDTEREVSRLVARRASGAVREGKFRRRQQA